MKWDKDFFSFDVTFIRFKCANKIERNLQEKFWKKKVYIFFQRINSNVNSKNEHELPLHKI